MKTNNEKNIIKELKEMVERNSKRRLTVENLIMDDNDEYEEYNDEEFTDETFNNEDTPISEPQTSVSANPEIASTITKIRQLSLQGMSVLADNVTDPNYEALKKILNFCDSTIETKQKNK